MSTSFRNVFRGGAVTRIEIPMIQRDYAQGRQDPHTTRIRDAFLGVLREALVGNQPVGLDFIYGEIENGRLIPLDGQQRLTTLFLLHWYLAARCGIAQAECAFLAEFTYRTRFSARHFCEKLVAQRPPFPLPATGKGAQARLSAWLVDQPWYAGAWRHDPTIASMLVTLDDLHALFTPDDATVCRTAWERLVAENDPAIVFDFLPVEEMGLSDELYIKMNSRGKPLTTFEHFKADFEKTLGDTSDAVRARFARNIDQEWSDLLWPLRNSASGKADENRIIDDEFLRLFHFIGDIVVQRHAFAVDASLFDKDVSQWARRIYGAGNPAAAEAQLDMFAMLDALVAQFKAREIRTAEDFGAWFGGYFTNRNYQSGRVAIFGKIDLFADCCAQYGVMRGQTRAFPLARSLLLFAFTEHISNPMPIEGPEVARRLRTIRNLVFASSNEIRPDRMAALLDSTAKYMRSGVLSDLRAYNGRQIEEEKAKAAFLIRFAGYPDLDETLHRLEDHALLRGCLAAFDLEVDADTFISRARLFHDIFPEDRDIPAKQICAALLACGPYQQRTQNGRYQFGSPKPEQLETWRGLLTAANEAGIKHALQLLLDRFDAIPGELAAARLQAIADAWLSEQEQAGWLDWRYYLVKYPAMRSGASGIYAAATDSMGFDLCMLNMSQLNSYYRDPYLHAVVAESGVSLGQDLADSRFYGWDDYRAEKRWLRLKDTEERLISCRPEGFQLCAPQDPEALVIFQDLCRKHEVRPDLILTVPQSANGDEIVDRADRVRKGARLLADLVAALARCRPARGETI